MLVASRGSRIAASAESFRVHRVHPVRDADGCPLPGLRMIHEYRLDLVEHFVLAGRRENGYVADAPHPVDDVIMTAVVHVKEGRLDPSRPVAITWSGQKPL